MFCKKAFHFFFKYLFINMDLVIFFRYNQVLFCCSTFSTSGHQYLNPFDMLSIYFLSGSSCSFPVLGSEVPILLKSHICFFWRTNSVRKYDLDTRCVLWHESVTIYISYQQVEPGNMSITEVYTHPCFVVCIYVHLTLSLYFLTE